MITWRDLFATLARFFQLSASIVFHRKLVFMVGGVVAYYGILYAFAYFRPDEGFSVEQALRVLVETPGTVIAIYLTMDLVAGERDKDTLEILFSTATSHYTTWGIRLITVSLLLLVTIVTMSTVSYFFFAEFPFFWGGLNAFVAALFVTCLTFLFSVFCRSGNAAAMLSVGVLLLVLITSNLLENTPYFLFLNPFQPPANVDEVIWLERSIYNRATVIGLSGLFVFFALRRMNFREKVL